MGEGKKGEVGLRRAKTLSTSRAIICTGNPMMMTVDCVPKRGRILLFKVENCTFLR